MSETIDMNTVRKIIRTQLDFEKELLAMFQEKDNYIGTFSCETTISKLSGILKAMEAFKTVEEEKEIA